MKPEPPSRAGLIRDPYTGAWREAEPADLEDAAENDGITMLLGILFAAAVVGAVVLWSVMT